MDSNKKKKKCFNFKQKKDCALKSIKEVNCFLNNLSIAFTIKKIVKK